MTLVTRHTRQEQQDKRVQPFESNRAFLEGLPGGPQVKAMDTIVSNRAVCPITH